MRRFFLIMLCCLWAAMPLARAEEAAPPKDAALEAIFTAVDALTIQGITPSISVETNEPWLSAVITQAGQIAPMLEGVQYDGLVFDTITGEQILFEDLFIDPDAATQALEEMALAAMTKNAYAEYTEVTPLPRDSFSVSRKLLTIYYPARMHSYFSGRSGAFSFYAYELDGLLNETVPLEKGDAAQAKAALSAALETGKLPAPLDVLSLSGSMTEAAETLGLIDVPDMLRDYAVYYFEAPIMRGVTLLSHSDDVEAATIDGIMAERIDFSGLFPSISSKDDCIAALGEPARAETIADSDSYSRLPDGESLIYEGESALLELHFVDSVLYSIALLAR